MTEIPEHLRKRAEEARKKAEGATGGDAAPAGSEAGANRHQRGPPERMVGMSRVSVAVELFLHHRVVHQHDPDGRLHEGHRRSSR